eukprot:SAG31_NODE_434_length_15737_cov_10.315450_11_plen_56_part_00
MSKSFLPSISGKLERHFGSCPNPFSLRFRSNSVVHIHTPNLSDAEVLTTRLYPIF